MKKLSIAVLIAVSSNMAIADDHAIGPYIGLGTSVSQIESDVVDFDTWGAHVFGGYRVHENFAVEVYVGQERLDDSDEGIHLSGNATQVGLSILPILPVTNNLDIFASLGYSYGTATVRAASHDEIGYFSEGSPDGWTSSDVFYVDATESNSGWPISVGVSYHFDMVFLRGSIGTLADEFGDIVTGSVDIGFEF